MIIEFLRAFSLIFFAEMGDKSQILAMTFATKYKIRNVLIGITIGIFFNHLLAVVLGAYIITVIPIANISIFAGIIFILFGLFSLQVTEDVEALNKSKVGPILTVAIAMFLGELGDKTQLSAIILSSEAVYPMIILFGTVLAMIFTSLFGIYVGIKFGSKIPEFALKILSSLIFITFGLIKVLGNIPTDINILFNILGIIALSGLYIILFIRFKSKYNENEQGILQRKAAELQDYYLLIKDRLDSICLGLDNCKSCSGDFCLIGYTKTIVKKILKKEKIDLQDVKMKLKKEFDTEKVEEALDITLKHLKNNWDNLDYEALHEIRKSFELLLYSEFIEASSYLEYKNKKSLIK